MNQDSRLQFSVKVAFESGFNLISKSMWIYKKVQILSYLQCFQMKEGSVYKPEELVKWQQKLK